MVLVPKIAVIGGGTAGIITSRNLIQLGLKPHLFEKQSTLGGLWKDEHQYLKWNTNIWKTNLSKYTCSFSDMLHTNENIFLNRNEMNEYLNSYCSKFLDNDNLKFYYNCNVVDIKECDDKYHVEWVDNSESISIEEATTNSREKNSMVFDGVILTSGFFSKPNKVLNDNIKYIHSSEYTCSKDYTKYKNVVVIGASFTSTEIVSNLAKESAIENIYHVLPNIPYVLPRYLPYNKSFLPLDLVFYKRTESYPKSEEVTTKDSIIEKHEYLLSIIGGTNSKQANVLGLPDTNKPPYVTISDDYISLLSLPDTNIKPINDKFTTMASSNTIQLSSGKVLNNIDLIIDCTGYKADLSYLSKPIQTLLNYDPNDQFTPISSCLDMYHPKLRHFGMVGMYRGPYFGIMELQARLLSQLLHQSLIQNKVWGLGNNVDDELLQSFKDKRSQENKPQFPHGDYVGHMDTLSSFISNFTPSIEYMSDTSLPVVIPSYYTNNKAISKEAFDQIQTLYVKAKNGYNIPTILIHSLIGNYTFHRTLSYINSQKGNSMNNYNTNDNEYIHGSITYKPQEDSSLRYREDGIYQTSKGISLPVFREYDYVLNNQSLDIYFIEGGKRAHLFLSLEFELKEDEDLTTTTWIASNDHLCSKDLYKGKFSVTFHGVDVVCVRMEYRVNGPEKDYLSVTELLPCYE